MARHEKLIIMQERLLRHRMANKHSASWERASSRGGIRKSWQWVFPVAPLRAVRLAGVDTSAATTRYHHCSSRRRRQQPRRQKRIVTTADVIWVVIVSAPTPRASRRPLLACPLFRQTPGRGTEKGPKLGTFAYHASAPYTTPPALTTYFSDMTRDRRALLSSASLHVRF